MLEWRGDEVKARVERASRLGIDETTAACVRLAKGNAPRRTSAYHGSIQMRPAAPRGKAVIGVWGSFSILYAIFLEIGTGLFGPKHRSYTIRPKNKKALFWPGAAHPVKSVRQDGIVAQHILQNAAEKEYPKLASRIRRHLV